MNEPVVDCDATAPISGRTACSGSYAAARASATRLTIVLTGACYSGAEALAKIDPKAIPDDNVIWTFHSYDPFLLTHQGATWAGDFIHYVTGLPYPALLRCRAASSTRRSRRSASASSDEAPWSRRQGMLDYLDEQIADDGHPESRTRRDHGAAVRDRGGLGQAERHRRRRTSTLGEFGMIRQEYGNPFVMPAASRAAYVEDMIEHAERHGFSWAIWSYGGAFGIVEEFDGKPAEPDVMEMIRRLD